LGSIPFGNLTQSKGKKMTRNLKALGLALLAVVAMSAMVASAASAQAWLPTWGKQLASRINMQSQAQSYALRENTVW
jgi:hypothetical protein